MASRALDTPHDGLAERTQCATDGCGFYACASGPACELRCAARAPPRAHSQHRGRCRNEATEGLCSQCFKAKMSAIQLTVDAAGAAASESSRQHAASLQAALAPAADVAPANAPEVGARRGGEAAMDAASTSAAAAPPVAQAAAPVDGGPPGPERPKKKNRCAVCSKKVGLMGFECKCGRLLCTAHRQAEEHQCDFDYRAEGKKRLEAANPVVAFSKVDNI